MLKLSWRHPVAVKARLVGRLSEALSECIILASFCQLEGLSDHPSIPLDDRSRYPVEACVKVKRVTGLTGKAFQSPYASIPLSGSLPVQVKDVEGLL